MSPEVTAAVIAAGASVLTLIGTLIAQIIGFRSTRKETADTLGSSASKWKRCFLNNVSS